MVGSQRHTQETHRQGRHLGNGATAPFYTLYFYSRSWIPYTLPLLDRAISTGIDNVGHPLNPVMPRWRLSKRDLRDVSNYVLKQLK